jgi:hypothetical protein
MGAMDEAALREDLEKVLGRRGLGLDENLGAVLARLDARLEAPDLPDRLRHYLSRRSYLKAAGWLDAPDAPHQP